jgi:predicted HAD superfamily Cof-like phosphohydrolase
MEKQIFQVMEFYKAFGHPIAYTPKILSLDRGFMRHRLLDEEVTELFEASVNKNIIEVADAITDCFYILIGTAIEYGIADKLPQLFDEVHKSNMSKLDENGNPIYREDGKVMKSNNYKSPNISDIIWPTIQK